MQLEVLVGMGQSIMRDQRSDVRKFGGFGAQELLAGGCIEEKITNRDRGASGKAGLFDAKHLSAIDFDDGSGRVFGRTGFEVQAGDGGDGGQSLAAESQCSDAEEILSFFDFRSGMAFEGEHGIVAHHAATIVGNLNQLLSASFDLDSNARRPCIERVLKKLLNHGGWALHHFAGSDLVGNSFGEYVDLAHEDYGQQWPEASVTDWRAERKGGSKASAAASKGDIAFRSNL